MRKLLLLAMLFSATNFAFAKKPCPTPNHAKVPAIAEFTYHKARKAILAAGWQPLVTVRYQDVDQELFGQAKGFWEKGYREIESCAGSGLVPCAFSFSDAYGNTLRVITTGEEKPSIKAYARVSSFEFVCQ